MSLTNRPGSTPSAPSTRKGVLVNDEVSFVINCAQNMQSFSTQQEKKPTKNNHTVISLDIHHLHPIY